MIRVRKSFIVAISLVFLATFFFASCTKKTTEPPVISYTVTFNTSGGTPAIPLQTIKANEKATKPADPTKDKVTFLGWYSDNTFKTSFSFDTAITANVTLYAKWSAIAPAGSFSVSFNLNGGTATTTAQVVNSGKKATKPTDPTNAGFKFDGWYTEAQFTNAFSFDTPITVNVTLYAKWTVITYKVSFNLEGGTASSDTADQVVNSGKKATEPAIPTKAGFTFEGWFTNNTTLKNKFDFTTPIIANITLYAKWRTKTIANIIADNPPPTAIKEILSHYKTTANLLFHYLKPDGTGDGSSWSQAAGNLKTVLEGITDATPDKVYIVLMAVGEYKAGATMSMKNNVAIVGGFEGQTDGDLTRSTTEVTSLSGEDSYQVFYNNNLDNSALLYGLDVVHGSNRSGGGIHNYNSSPTFIHINLLNNTSTSSIGNGGGGMYNQNSSPTLSNVTFSNNTTGGRGGGMWNSSNRNRSPILTNVIFSNNTSQYGGGGMSNGGSSPILTNVTFFNNSSRYEGGGMDGYNSSPILINTVFFANTSTNQRARAGGIIFYGGGDALIVGSIVWGNTGKGSATNAGSQIAIDNAKINLSHTILAGGKDMISGTPANIFYDGNQNMDSDPLLGTIANHGGFVSTIDIPSNSPAVDLGVYVKRKDRAIYISEDNSTWYRLQADGTKTAETPPADAIDLTATDARGYARIGRPDAGAYEAGATP